eukprot:TRINITY_DN72717_c0_g1_i1.p1 TRINITY_DN72717_c0_g1~~TRINITY_DN72717_c0_g1_i1.p1  ORF type:complete len:303 (+),score=-7.02 TRINITY_DN72717_c0_g1_i1:106-1014(+)
MTKYLFVLCLALVACKCQEPAVTQAYTDYLKKHASWEVVDYNENVFKGWTEEEFRSMFTQDPPPEIPLKNMKRLPLVEPLPESIDRTFDKCVHQAINQANCNSCWAIAVAGTFSDNCCRYYQKDLGWLSPQELLSCVVRDNKGCNRGGTREAGIEYASKMGLVPSTCFQYRGYEASCPNICPDNMHDWTRSHVCRCQQHIHCGNQLFEWMDCLRLGSITVSMDVYRDLEYYRRGIYCRTSTAEFMGVHSIRCVGYQISSIRYLTCVNSWGTEWGDNGLLHINVEEGCGLRYDRNAYTCIDFY